MAQGSESQQGAERFCVLGGNKGGMTECISIYLAEMHPRVWGPWKTSAGFIKLVNMLCLCKKNWEFINRFSNSDPSPCAVGFLVLTLRLWIPHIRSMTRKASSRSTAPHFFWGGEAGVVGKHWGTSGEPTLATWSFALKADIFFFFVSQVDWCILVTWFVTKGTINAPAVLLPRGTPLI